MKNTKTNDKEYIEMALALAEASISSGGGPFGAVVVLNDKVIAKACNRVVADADPTAHAEVLAIRKAAVELGTHLLEECVLYSSCEPCPMCFGAIYWAGIRKVVYAATRYDAALAGFNDDFIYKEMLLPSDKRSIEWVNTGKEDGRSVFEKWINFPDKILY